MTGELSCPGTRGMVTPPRAKCILIRAAHGTRTQASIYVGDCCGASPERIFHRSQPRASVLKPFPALLLAQEDMKACTFAPELSSQKTRLGRSLSPQRQRPVYEELYQEAATQRFARTLVRGRAAAAATVAADCGVGTRRVLRNR